MRCDRCKAWSGHSLTRLCISCRTKQCDICGFDFQLTIKTMEDKSCPSCRRLPYQKKLALKAKMKAVSAVVVVGFLLGSCTPSVNEVAPTTVEEIVGNSQFCTRYEWKNRGIAPIDYFVEIAKAYKIEMCGGVEFKTNGTPDKDALTYYGIESSLINTYTFLTGLGVRESSGKFCTGRDASASNTGVMEAEAGAFQYSYNSINAASELKDLFYNYRGKYPRVCSSKNWGDGIGFEFQKLSKENPEFSIKYAARLIRVLRKHFGPINRREVEYVPACREMLSKIKC